MISDNERVFVHLGSSKLLKEDKIIYRSPITFLCCGLAPLNDGTHLQKKPVINSIDSLSLLNTDKVKFIPDFKLGHDETTSSMDQLYSFAAALHQ